MRLAKFHVVTLAVLLGLCPLSPTPAQADSKQHSAPKHSKTKSKNKAPTPQVQQPQPNPVPPPPPPTPEQMPSTPPSVTYTDRQLTIVAQNSTLSDILNAVRHKTGAEFDVPSTASERVVGRFGPGPARDVLATLLNGSHFNYVMVGTEADPNSVARVILTAKTGEETGPMPGAQPGQPPSFQQAVLPPGQPQQFSPPQPNLPQQMQMSAEPADDDQANADDSADAADDNASDQEGNDQGQNPNQPAVKTPEQLLQELQRQQQLMQQQQQLQQQQGQSQPQGQPQPQVQPAQPPQLIYSNPPKEKPEN